MLIVGSAGAVPGALAGQHADVVYLGVGQLGSSPNSTWSTTGPRPCAPSAPDAWC